MNSDLDKKKVKRSVWSNISCETCGRETWDERKLLFSIHPLFFDTFFNSFDSKKFLDTPYLPSHRLFINTILEQTWYFGRCSGSKLSLTTFSCLSSLLRYFSIWSRVTDRQGKEWSKSFWKIPLKRCAEEGVKSGMNRKKVKKQKSKHLSSVQDHD